MSTKAVKTTFLDRIGLNEEEQKVYLSLLALGPLSAGEISKYTTIKPISKVRTVLEKLFSKNYAYNIEGLVDKAIGLYPFKDIAEEAGKDAKIIEQLVAELKTYVAEQIKHFDKVMKDADDQVKTEKKKANDKIAQNSTQTRAAIDSKTTETAKLITTSVDMTKKSINTSADAFLKNQTDVTNTFETTTNDNFTTFATDLKGKAATSLQKMSESISAKNSDFLVTSKKSFDETNKGITTKTDALAKGLMNDSKVGLSATKDHILTGLESFVTETEGNTKTLNDTLKATVNEQGVAIKTTTEEAKKNRINLNKQFKNDLNISFEKVKTDFGKDLKDFQNKLGIKLEKLIEKFKTQVDELKLSTTKEITLLCDEANVTIEELAKKHNEAIATNVDLDNKAIEDGTTVTLTKINEQNAKSLKTIGTATDTIHSSATLLKANYGADVTTKIDETITTMNTSITTTSQQIKDDFATTTKTVTDKLQTLTTANSKDTSIIATKQTDEIKGITDSLVSNNKQKLAEAKTKLSTETKTTKQKIATDASGGIDSIGTTSFSAITDISTNAKAGINKNEETSVSAITEISSVVETTVKKEIETVKGGFDDYYKRFANDSVKITKLMIDFKAQHEALLGAVTTHPKPRIETAILYSKEAVFERMEDMLTKRIKSNITMVIPDPTDIPSKILGKVKPQAKMTIISKIDEVSNKKLIDEIKASDSLGRTKIRKIGLQDMVGYSEYIAFDRDGGEEMLIAFKDETEKEWVGILSTSDGFKNVVIGETLGRQALSISRELK